MLNSKSLTCFIPAKGTSQRLAGKNTRICDGLPLVAYPVLLAGKCGIFDHIVVSSESSRIFGLLDGTFITRHLRPNELSLPASSVWDAVHDYMETADKTDFIALLHPTSPCLRPETITAATERMLLFDDCRDAVVSISRSGTYSWSSGEFPNFSDVRGTQFHVPRFQLNNAIFVAKWDKLFESINIYKLNWLPYDIPLDEAVDIDDETDLQMAEAIIQWRNRNDKDYKPIP